MPQFTITCRVVRALVESKTVEIEVEAEDEDAAREAAYQKIERDDINKYLNREDKDWEIESEEVELSEIEEIVGAEEDE